MSPHNRTGGTRGRWVGGMHGWKMRHCSGQYVGTSVAMHDGVVRRDQCRHGPWSFTRDTCRHGTVSCTRDTCRHGTVSCTRDMAAVPPWNCMHKEEERGILLDKKSALLKGVPRPLKYKLRSWKGHLSETCKIETDTACTTQILKKLIVFFEHAALLGAVPQCHRIIVRAARGGGGSAACMDGRCGTAQASTWGRVSPCTMESYAETNAAMDRGVLRGTRAAMAP